MTGVKDGINAGVGRFVAGGLGTGFDGDSNVITLGLGNFQGCNDEKLEGLVTGFQDGINAGIGLCIAGWLDTGLTEIYLE